MNKARFAELIGVSHQMVSKYALAGAVVCDENGIVQVAESLAALEGKLHEEKRQRALSIAGSLPLSAAAKPSAKAEKDAIDRDLKLAQLGRETGQLVRADDVDEAGRRAVAAMREGFSVGRRDSAARICAALSIPAEKASALARLLGEEFEHAMGLFAREMMRQAESRTPPIPMQAPPPPAAMAGQLF